MLFSLTIYFTATLSTSDVYKALLPPFKNFFATAKQTPRKIDKSSMYSLMNFLQTEYIHVASTQIETEHYQYSRPYLSAPFESFVTF